jgi:hypothetical protein
MGTGTGSGSNSTIGGSTIGGSTIGGSTIGGSTSGSTATTQGTTTIGPAGNLVTDGDFSNPSSPLWGLSGTGMAYATITVSNNAACITSSAAYPGNITLGWPADMSAGMVISSANTYTFSYTVYTLSGTVSIDSKVGHSVTPFTPTEVESLYDSATTTPQTYSHAITAASDSSAGVALSFDPNMASQTVCFANVSVVQN